MNRISCNAFCHNRLAASCMDSLEVMGSQRPFVDLEEKPSSFEREKKPRARSVKEVDFSFSFSIQ